MRLTFGYGINDGGGLYIIRDNFILVPLVGVSEWKYATCGRSTDSAWRSSFNSPKRFRVKEVGPITA